MVGVNVEVGVFKSSVWKPFREADVYILYDYGIDDIRANLKFVKETTADSVYRIGNRTLGKSLDQAIRAVEEDGLEKELREKVISLWNEVECQFAERRKPREW